MNLQSRLPAEAKKVFEGIVYDIYQWQQELYDGSFTTFEMAKHIDAVSIVPIVDDKIVILRETQPRDVERISFPGGHIDAGETPYEAAVRELREETGMVFKTVKLVAVDDLGDAKLDWWVYRFVATDFIEQGPVKLDPGEKIEQETVTFERAKELSAHNHFMSLSVMDKVDTLSQLSNYPPLSLQ